MKINVKYPQFKKGKVLIHTGFRDDLDIPFVEKICNVLGCKLSCEFYNGMYEIETPIGEEVKVAMDFIDNYPEFFESYERIDIRVDYISDIVERVKGNTQELFDNYIGFTDNKRIINTSDFNGDIDKIIDDLNSLKIIK